MMRLCLVMAWDGMGWHGKRKNHMEHSSEGVKKEKINITPTPHQHHININRHPIYIFNTFDVLYSICGQHFLFHQTHYHHHDTAHTILTHIHAHNIHTYIHTSTHTHQSPCMRQNVLPSRHNPHRTSTSTSYIPRVPTSKATQYARYALSLFIRQKVPSHLLHDPFHAIIIHQTDRDRHPTFKRNAYSRVEMNIKQMIFRGTCYIEYIMSDPFNSNFFILRSPSPLEKRFISDQTSRNRFPIALKSNASAINK